MQYIEQDYNRMKQKNKNIRDYLLFSERLIAEKMFFEWCEQNGVDKTRPFSVIGFMEINGWINEEKLILDVGKVRSKYLSS